MKENDYEGTFFHYPCGIIYNKQTGITSAKVWPEPSFVFYIVSSSNIDKSVWIWPHDKISQYSNNIAIITTKPMWCITANHGNIANTDESYFTTNRLHTTNIIEAMT